MISAPVVITGRSSRRYTTSVVRVEACPTSRAISSMLTPRWLIRLTNEVRSSRGVRVGLIFNRAWSVIEHGDDAPRPTDEQRGWREILLAAGLQGAIFALVRAAVDRGIAEGTRKLTGIWPGEEGQQPDNPARCGNS